MRNAVINRLNYFAAKNKKVFVIAGDAGYGVLDEYKKNFPKRFLNLGIAEQNTISFAAGLSLAGFKVFVYNIIPFLLYRPYEQIRNDICYQNLPVVLIGIGSGVTYAPQGVTHYSVEDIALARTLPNLTILSPSDPIEARLCVDYAFYSKNPVYIRLAKSGEPKIHSALIKRIDKPITIQKGKRIAVLFHGSVGCEVGNLIQSLREKVAFISIPMLNKFDFTSLDEALKKIDTIITVEEHFVDGGLGSIIAEWIVRQNKKFKLVKLGIKNEFIHSIRNTLGMREIYGISASAIRKVIQKEYKR